MNEQKSFRIPVLKKDDEYYKIARMLIRKALEDRIHHERRHGKKWFMRDEDYLAAAWKLQASRDVHFMHIAETAPDGSVVKFSGATPKDFALVKRVAEAN